VIRRLVRAWRRRWSAPTRAARAAYERDWVLVSAQATARGLEVLRYPLFEGGLHPEGYIDFECGFAARHLRLASPRTVLDVGSYRTFLRGLSAAFEVTTLDIRERQQAWGTETVLTGDARRIPAPDASFDAVVSLSSIEHFGLGRYGDALDLDADRIAAAEMRRVLRPGGVLVLTTTLTRGRAALAFNAHRIYDLPGARGLLEGLPPIDERFFSHRRAGAVPIEEITDARGEWDVYCACARKPGSAADVSLRNPRSHR
jgi:SAM-dependent methyltransferase